MAVIKKKFFEINLGLVNQEIGLYAKSEKELVGKTVKIDLTRKLRGKSLEITFKIDMEKEKQNLGEFVLDGSLEELIDQAVSLHEFDCSSEESARVLRRLKEAAENYKGDMASFLDDLSLERGIDHVGLLGDRVALMSLHAAKGLEWPVVFISGCEDKLLPCTLFGYRDEEEEKRLLYVGMTRAKKKLYLSRACFRTIYGKRERTEPSPFLSSIPSRTARSESRAGPL